MSYVHPLVLAELLKDPDEDVVPKIRAALAGGSGDRPPGEGSGPAQVIRFPVERVRRTPEDKPRADNPTKHPSSTDGPSGRNADALWPAWMAKVLMRRFASTSADAAPADRRLTV